MLNLDSKNGGIFFQHRECVRCERVQQWLNGRSRRRDPEEVKHFYARELLPHLARKEGWLRPDASEEERRNFLKGRSGKRRNLERSIEIVTPRGRPTVREISPGRLQFVAAWLDHWRRGDVLELESAHLTFEGQYWRDALRLAETARGMSHEEYCRQRETLSRRLAAAFLGCTERTIRNALNREAEELGILDIDGEKWVQDVILPASLEGRGPKIRLKDPGRWLRWMQDSPRSESQQKDVEARLSRPEAKRWIGG